MSLLSVITKALAPRPNGGSLIRRAGLSLRAGFDAAQTNDENRKHWSLADGLSADAAANPAIRAIVRARARYECANNSYARGIIDTLANDCIGTGPRLQLGLEDQAANRKIEAAFAEWASAVKLAEKLRLLRMARAESGEAFIILTSNPELPTAIKLDLRVIEADQVATPDASILIQPLATDGVVFDKHGNPVEYHVLKQHPGDTRNIFALRGSEYDKIPAASVIHYFRASRPGQTRGLPDIMPALPLFAQLRRFTLATIAAAETAADIAGVIQTQAPPGGETADVEPLDAVEIERRSLMTLPAGWQMGQMKAEHPTTTFSDFVGKILNEIARSLSMPFNIAAGNSSGYNYASGRLDHQTYYKALRVDRHLIASMVLDHVLRAWLNEAVLISGALPTGVRTLVATGATLTHQWFWDGHEHVDPLKEAEAQAKRLESHTTTLAAEYASRGLDWETEIRQRAKEAALLKELGLDAATAKPAGDKQPAGAKREPDDDEKEGDDE